MAPSLVDGDIVVAKRTLPKVGQIAVAQVKEREVIKRVKEVRGGRFYLTGDNGDESTDSRHYGFVAKKDILGTIMLVMPRATSPPKPVKPYGILLGRCMAVLLIVMTLVHLYRIDTFIPLLDQAFPGGELAATLAALVIILSELFAIPFALRVYLSPLAHLVSGALMVFAALWWVAVDVLTIGSGVNTAEMGEFLPVPANTLVLVLNMVWLGMAYFTLYTLGYNNLSLRPRLRS